MKPSSDLGRGYIWHIGNIHKIDSSGLVFALGRLTKSRFERLDETTQDFIETDIDIAPYTHIFYETRLQFCAIASKSQLSPSIPAVGRQLARLLTIASKSLSRDVEAIDIFEIKDPEDFVSALGSAHAIKQFSITFRRPNPFDASDFQRPMEKLLAAAAGSRGRTILSGHEMDSAVLSALARAAAASGDDASAKMRMSEGDPLITKTLRGKRSIVVAEKSDSEEKRNAFLEMIRRKYKSIRGSDKSGDQDK